ncbi:MAG: DUF3500 domain-containing protein [Bacteroidota bacterium]
MKSSKLTQILTWILGVLMLVLLMIWINRETLSTAVGGSYFEKMEAEHLQEAFRGIETSEGQAEGLFPIQATGVSTQPIVAAARAFLQSLDADQQAAVSFPVDDEEWRRWCNVDNGIFTRQGVSLKEMNPAQKEAAFGLLSASLSAKGLSLSKDIMKTDQTLREFNDDNEIFDEELYFFTIMGEPSATEPWGWQLDGHHLIINYFVLGDQVVMTPTFLGAEPVIATTGKYAGNTLFQDEQNLGLAFMKGLPEDLQQAALLDPEKTHNHNKAEAFKDNLTIDYEGLSVAKLDSIQRTELLHLVGLYIHNMREDHARIKMEEVEAHLEDTWFVWKGQLTEDGVFYYRIHSPVLLIEFDHQRAVGAPADDDLPTRNHIHTVIRTPNGNDYGKDLLRQHLERHHH